MCKKAKFLFPKLEVLSQIHLMFITTPTAHCLRMTKFLRRPYAVFIITTSQVFPGSLEKEFYKTSPTEWAHLTTLMKFGLFFTWLAINISPYFQQHSN